MYHLRKYERNIYEFQLLLLGNYIYYGYVEIIYHLLWNKESIVIAQGHTC